ncbi:MAG: glycosyltransferase family 39 protein [Anaerolineae bacterium]|jgi:4-amino-4-deoxy-L-arabinose transferase-like glycosyltransferase
MRKRPLRLLLAVGLLLALYAQMMGSARVKSATYDEQEYYARGYAVLKTGDMRLRLRHPLLTNLISAAPLLLLRDLELPTDHRSWANADFHEFSAQFVWHYNTARADQIVFLTRWPMMLLTLLLAAVVYRWASELYGAGAGILALTLSAADPNLIAHGRLANTDIGATASILGATYAFWRYQRRPSRRGLALAGITLGLAQTTRFTALLLGPVFGLLLLLEAWRAAPGERRRFLTTLLALGAISLFTIWAVYGFTWGPVDKIGLSLPAPGHWNELVSLLERLSRDDLAFLMGRVYRGGHWAYFFVAWLVKTPLPTLALMGWAGLAALRRRRADDLYLLLPAGAYFASGVFSSLNTGYRLILPVLPFLLVFAGRGASDRPRRALVERAGVLVLAGWVVADAATIYPDYLAFFNALAGGPQGGYRVLVDSNLDWGQDLPGLRCYQETHDELAEGGEILYLSWFGIAPPEHYGVRYRFLPGFPPFEDPATRVYHPQRPLAGLYAISATHLQGVLLDDPDTFAWFRRQTPLVRIGHSIFVYRVPAGGPAQNVALSGLRLDQVPGGALDEHVGSNDLRLRWFDARHSLILMGDAAPVTYFIAADQQEAAAWWERFLEREQSLTVSPVERQAGETGYAIYRPVAQAQIAAQIATVRDRSTVWTDLEALQPLALPLTFGDQLAFVGYELLTPAVAPKEPVSLLTYWRVIAPAAGDLKIFVHLLDESGQILGQYDGLDVAVAGWRAGDVIAQRHVFEITADPGRHRLQVGLYTPQTMQRLPVLAHDGTVLGDRLLLGEVVVETADVDKSHAP